MAIIGTCIENYKINDKRSKILVKGYQDENHLTDKELMLIPLFTEYAATVTAFGRYLYKNVLNIGPDLNSYKEMVKIAESAKLQELDLV